MLGPPPGFCQIASVPEMARLAAVHVVHPEGAAVPAASNDAVVPGGGSSSTKFADRNVPALPERVKPKGLAPSNPALPVRLYQASAVKPLGLVTWHAEQ